MHLANDDIPSIAVMTDDRLGGEVMNPSNISSPATEIAMTCTLSHIALHSKILS